jgi:hypothetical protein
VLIFRRKHQFFFAKRRVLQKALTFVRRLPFSYRRTLFIQQVLLGGFLRVLVARMRLDVAKLLKKSGLIKITVVFLYNRRVTAQILSAFFIHKFRKMYLPKEVVGRFFSRIVKTRRRGESKVLGPSLWGLSALMIKASGRFTRKQRAFYQVYQFWCAFFEHSFSKGSL